MGPISGAEFIVLIVVAAIVLGPERLPEYAQQLARLVKGLRTMAQGAGEQVRAEMGPEFDDLDWRKLDPRQYDPRRIVREALSDAWDPDDPMGLKGAGLDRAGLEGAFNGAGGDSPPDKPVSRGGPSSQAGADRPARPVFDEDAT